MLICYCVIAALVVALVFKNTRYAIRQYFADRNRAILTVYLSFLMLLGYLILHMSYRLIDAIQKSEASEPAQPTPYVAARLRGQHLSANDVE